MGSNQWFAQVVIIASLACGVCLGTGLGDNPPSLQLTDCPNNVPASASPKVSMYVMSMCPDGMNAETVFNSALSHMQGSAVAVEPHFVIFGEEAYSKGKPENKAKCEGGYCSMHGIGELHEDVRQLCLHQSHPDKWWPYVKAFNENCGGDDGRDKIEHCSQSAAASVGIAYGDLESCRTSQGMAMLKGEYERNQQHGVTGSPTLVVNGTPFLSERLNPHPVSDAKESDALHALCLGFTPDTAPPQCTQVQCSSDGRLVSTLADDSLFGDSAAQPISGVMAAGIPATAAAGATQAAMGATQSIGLVGASGGSTAGATEIALSTSYLRAGVPVTAGQARQDADLTEKCASDVTGAECLRAKSATAKAKWDAMMKATRDENPWA